MATETIYVVTEEQDNRNGLGYQQYPVVAYRNESTAKLAARKDYRSYHRVALKSRLGKE